MGTLLDSPHSSQKSLPLTNKELTIGIYFLHDYYTNYQKMKHGTYQDWQQVLYKSQKELKL